MSREEFLEAVLDEVTEGRALPGSAAPRLQRLDRIVTRALKLFHEKDDEVVEPEYIVIPQAAFQTPLFKAKRQVILPDRVNAVYKLHFCGPVVGGRGMEIDRDFRKTNSLLMGNGLAGGDSDQMVYAVANAYYTDFLRSFHLRTCSYSFSEYSHCLTVEGRDPSQDMVAHCAVYIADEAIFGMPRFLDYCTGRAKVSVANVLGFAEQKLIGGFSINVADMKSDGKELIEKVEDEWKEQREAADFMEEF